jgi:hypothetical protein
MWSLLLSVLHTVKSGSGLTNRLAAILSMEDMEMQLNQREASLVDAFRRLPPDAARELSALAERLAETRAEPQDRLVGPLVR